MAAAKVIADRKRAWRWPKVLTISLMLLVTVGMVYPRLTVCQDHTQIDRHSGSTRGYRSWPFGLKTGHWHKDSPLALALDRHFPGKWQARWSFFGSSGRGIFGQHTLISCSHTGKAACLLNYPPELMAAYFDAAGPQATWAVHELLVQEKEEEFKALISRIIEVELESASHHRAAQ